MSSVDNSAAQLGDRVIGRARDLEPNLINWRRDFHRNAELGFCEFRTASVIVTQLRALGYEVALGARAMDPTAIFDLPTDKVNAAYAQALEEADQAGIISDMKGGLTGIVADLDMGEPGPTVAFRFDLDALPIQEAADSSHRPVVEGFVSERPGSMHACGHDGHSAIGLGVAHVLAEMRPLLRGRVRLIFQPAEEGARGGAYAIVARGWADDVDYFVGCHLGLGVPTGAMVSRGYLLATSKYRVMFHGKGTHVVNSPQDGRNALLAAASAALALHAIPPHSEGWFSINVGYLQAGDEQGVTPETSFMELGFWTDATRVAEYVKSRVFEILEGTAAAWGVKVEVTQIGQAPTADQDSELAAVARQAAQSVDGLQDIEDSTQCLAADDAEAFIERVTERGGKGIYVLVGSTLADGHHAATFDIDEKSLLLGTTLLSQIAATLLAR